MTSPTDAAVARAFWKVDGFIDLDRHERRILQIIAAEARKFDAEAGGTDRQTEDEAEALEIGRKAWADVPDAAEWQRDIRGTEPQAPAPFHGIEVIESPVMPDDRIVISQAGKTLATLLIDPPYDRCPTCTAHLPVGKTCGGDECGLKRCSHPHCGTPDQQGPCAFDSCPRREK